MIIWGIIHEGIWKIYHCWKYGPFIYLIEKWNPAIWLSILNLGPAWHCLVGRYLQPKHKQIGIQINPSDGWVSFLDHIYQRTISLAKIKVFLIAQPLYSKNFKHWVNNAASPYYTFIKLWPTEVISSKNALNFEFHL